MKKVFILEDDTDRIKWFQSIFPNAIFATNPIHGYDVLKENLDLDAIFLDNDLGGPYMRGPYGDGIDLVKDIVKEKLHLNTLIVLHSHNDEKVLEMLELLKKTHNNVKRITFYDMRYERKEKDIEDLIF